MAPHRGKDLMWQQCSFVRSFSGCIRRFRRLLLPCPVIDSWRQLQPLAAPQRRLQTHSVSQCSVGECSCHAQLAASQPCGRNGGSKGDAWPPALALRPTGRGSRKRLHTGNAYGLHSREAALWRFFCSLPPSAISALSLCNCTLLHEPLMNIMWLTTLSDKCH